jgi:hypothetical protein
MSFNLNSFRKFQTAAHWSDAWNDSRHARKNRTPSAKIQYTPPPRAPVNRTRRLTRERRLAGLGFRFRAYVSVRPM